MCGRKKKWISLARMKRSKSMNLKKEWIKLRKNNDLRNSEKHLRKLMERSTHRNQGMKATNLCLSHFQNQTNQQSSSAQMSSFKGKTPYIQTTRRKVLKINVLRNNPIPVSISNRNYLWTRPCLEPNRAKRRLDRPWWFLPPRLRAYKSCIRRFQEKKLSQNVRN